MTDPNYAVAPGEFLKEWLKEKGMSRREAAIELMYSKEHVNRIIDGKVAVGEPTARRLELLTGIPKNAWIRHELGYKDDLERLQRTRMQNAMLIREAEASASLDRDSTFSLGPQDVITFSKAALEEALRDVFAWADYDLMKALEEPEDEGGHTFDDAVDRFMQHLEG